MLLVSIRKGSKTVKHLWVIVMLVVAPAATADLMLQARQTVDIYGSSALSQRLADVDYQLTWQLTGQETEQGCLPAQVMVSLTAPLMIHSIGRIHQPGKTIGWRCLVMNVKYASGLCYQLTG